MKARAPLTITLDGAAAKDVAQLRRIAIPDLWHLAHSKQFFPSDAERDAVLLVWRVAHHLKCTLSQSSKDTNETQTIGENINEEEKRKGAALKRRRQLFG